MSSSIPSSLPEIAEWLRAQREHDHRPLHELLGSRGLEPGTLMEIVSMDLIGAFRRGEQIPVESYLGYFPELAADAERVLDLIDVEVCIRRECGEKVEVQELQQRFPALAERLAKLADLDAMEQNLLSLARAPNSSLNAQQETNNAPDLSIDESLLRPSRNKTLNLDGETLEPPEGVRILHLVASRSGVQLYRAIQVDERRPLAVKVIRQSVADRMPPQAWLDRLEAIAQLSHPNLCPAESVIANNHHYVVLRPWIEGTCWGTWAARSLGLETILPRLAQLADLLQVLANAGVPHGHVHPGNLIIDHQEKLWLTDHGCGGHSPYSQPWLPAVEDPRAVSQEAWLKRDWFAVATLAIHAIDRQPREVQHQSHDLRHRLDDIRQSDKPLNVESISRLLRDYLDGRKSSSITRLWPASWWRS